MQKAQKNVPRQGNIYTLAQSLTPPPKLIKGNGTDAKDLKHLQRRAKTKVITQTVILPLIKLAEANGEHDKAKAYRNTYYCQERITKVGERLYGDYCKNRFCSLCAGNRKAEIINKYLPVLQTWEQPFFVTLTAKAIGKETLGSRIDRMQKAFRRLLNRNKKRAERGREIKLIGVKTLECNFNPQKRTYNPHFHLIVANADMAWVVVNEWLKQCTKTHAAPQSQDLREVKDLEKNLIEIIKYGSKVFTDPTMQAKSGKKYNPMIYIKAYHNIIWAMKKHRVFDRFGFNLPQQPKQTNIGYTQDYEELVFCANVFDWVNIETAALQTGYQPTQELMAILTENIDLEAE